MADPASHKVIVIPHPEIASGYWARIAVSGQPPEWILDPAGSRRIFATKEAAELAAYRTLVFHINSGPVSKPKTAKPSAPVRGRVTTTETERDRVFARFKGAKPN